MPHNSDDPLNQGQQSWQGQNLNPPGTPQSQVPVRRSGQKPPQKQKTFYPHPPIQGNNPAQIPVAQLYNNQPEQQPIILSAQSGQRQADAEAIETQRQVELPSRGSQAAFSGTHGTVIAAVQQRESQQREQFGTFEYALVGVVIVLIAAIIATIITFFSNLSLRSFDSAKFAWLFLEIIIYALCVFAGRLWGRYQLDTAAKRESEQLKQYVNRLQSDNDRIRNERANLQNQLFSAQSELAAIKKVPPPVAPPPDKVPSGPLPPVVKSPEQIGRILPQQTIHDVILDPPDFNEREQREHPHEKFYPERGKSWTLRSGWNIIGASRRGYGHSYEGKYREDDFEIWHTSTDTRSLQPDMVMVAIADGVSSKPYSRRGARAAVQGAISITNTSVQWEELQKAIGKRTPIATWQNAAFNALMGSFQAAHDFVEQRAKFYRISVDDMQSTLLVYLAIPVEHQLFVASVQVGDGALFAMRQEGAKPRERWQWLQQPQIQATGNEVQPFMRTGPEIWRQYFHSTLLDNPSFIMGMTDGTADDIESPRATPDVKDPDPFYYVDDFYQHILQAVTNAPQPAEALLKFLEYKKKQSFDDRTVVCLYR